MSNFYQILGKKDMAVVFIELLRQIGKVAQILRVLAGAVDVGYFMLADNVLQVINIFINILWMIKNIVN